MTPGRVAFTMRRSWTKGRVMSWVVWSRTVWDFIALLRMACLINSFFFFFHIIFLAWGWLTTVNWNRGKWNLEWGGRLLYKHRKVENYWVIMSWWDKEAIMADREEERGWEEIKREKEEERRREGTKEGENIYFWARNEKKYQLLVPNQ